MKEEEDMVQEGAPEEGGKKERGKSLKRAAEFLRNSTVAVLRGEFLIRLRFDRYFLHIIYLFFLAVMSIWINGAGQTGGQDKMNRKKSRREYGN